MSILDGRQVKIQILKELKEKLLKLNESIGLVVIQIGDDAASSVYVRQKNKMATDLNYKFQRYIFPRQISISGSPKARPGFHRNTPASRILFLISGVFRPSIYTP